MHPVARVAKSLVGRRRGDLVSLRFTERGRSLVAWCPDDETFTLARELLLDRVYEGGAVGLAPGMGTVVDAGAHVGIFSLQAAQWARRVVALEANPVNAALAALNVERNRLGNVEVRPCALWGFSTDALVFSAAAHSGGGSIAGSRRGGSDETVVPATSLDDLVDELGPIDLLKIDIEGGEYDVLGNCKQLGSIRQIVGEVHLADAGDRPKRDGLVELLVEAGFSVQLLSEHELLQPSRAGRLWQNRGRLSGHVLTKALAAAYYLAPIEKPLRAAGATYELPVVLARQAGAADQPRCSTT